MLDKAESLPFAGYSWLSAHKRDNADEGLAGNIFGILIFAAVPAVVSAGLAEVMCGGIAKCFTGAAKSLDLDREHGIGNLALMIRRNTQ